jgi:hypothetical protein
MWGDDTNNVINQHNFSSPVQIGSSSWVSVYAGGYHSLGLRGWILWDLCMGI